MSKKKSKGKVNRTRALQQDLGEGSIPRFIYDQLCERPYNLQEIQQRSEGRYKGRGEAPELHLYSEVSAWLGFLVDRAVVRRDVETGRYKIVDPVEGLPKPKPTEEGKASVTEGHKSTSHSANAEQDSDVPVSEREELYSPSKAVKANRSVKGKAWVNGKEKVLTITEYEVIVALLKVGANGVTKDRLDDKSGHTEARKYLAKLKKQDPDWDDEIIMPGGSGRGGYRLK